MQKIRNKDDTVCYRIRQQPHNLHKLEVEESIIENLDIK